MFNMWISRGLLALTILFASAAAHAQISIQYASQNLPDEIEGHDRWRYAYTVSGMFSEFQSFEIVFDAARFESLESFPASPSGDWFASTVQPLPGVPADGLYSALALTAGPSTETEFHVTFIWKGPGVPGAQPFNILTDTFGLIASGITAPVPEPEIFGLMGMGLLVVWLGFRRRRA